MIENRLTHEQISVVLQFLDNNSLCLGFVIPNGEKIIAMLPRVSGSFHLLSSEEEKEGIGAFSLNCRLFSARGSPCQNCRHLLSIDRKRKSRKTESNQVHPNFNKRYMNKDEVQMQLRYAQRAKRNATKREQYWKDRYFKECLELDGEDSTDVSSIFGSLSEIDVPEDMQCLWQQQKKNLEHRKQEWLQVASQVSKARTKKKIF